MEIPVLARSNNLSVLSYLKFFKNWNPFAPRIWVFVRNKFSKVGYPQQNYANAADACSFKRLRFSADGFDPKLSTRKWHSSEKLHKKSISPSGLKPADVRLIS